MNPLRGISLITTIIGLGSVLFSVPAPAAIKAINQVPSSSAQTAAQNDDALAAEELYAGLPVASVVEHPADQSWATAVFLPQFHQSPGTAAADPKNDRGEKTQEEIYQIVQRITDQTSTRLVMVEGELDGDVDSHKTALLKEKIIQRDQLAQAIDDTEALLTSHGYSSEDIDDFRQAAHAQLAVTDRELILKGGAANLAARGVPLVLVGAEELATQNQSRELVRDHLYLKDRLAAVQKNEQRQLSALQTDNLLAIPQSLIQKLRNGKKPDRTNKADTMSLTKVLSKISTQASAHNDQAVLSAITGVEHAADALAAFPITLQAAQGTQRAPSRMDNPYKGIASTTQLEQMLKENEAQIEHVVIEQRNTETAVNFVDALKRHQQTTGIIQYGAGHIEGMVAELNKQGVDVIVVTPNEVTKHATQ